MGYKIHKIEIILRLDSHNGPEQERDRQLAEEAELRISARSGSRISKR